MYSYILYIYYSLQSLSQLRVLDLSENYSLKKVPSVVGEINTLNELNLSDCGLSDLSQRLVLVYIVSRRNRVGGEKLKRITYTIYASTRDLSALCNC